jgi:hypothetical protein
MDFDQARRDITDWITGFVEQPHPALNGWPPCPYARRARTDNLLDIRPGQIEPYADLQKAEMGRFDVIAYVYDPTEFDPLEFNQQVESVNLGFLTAQDMIALADHPASPELVNGVCMNQGTWAIVFLQSLTKLHSHAKTLADRGYYTNWPESYLQELFTGRTDPRS